MAVQRSRLGSDRPHAKYNISGTPWRWLSWPGIPPYISMGASLAQESFVLARRVMVSPVLLLPRNGGSTLYSISNFGIQSRYIPTAVSGLLHFWEIHHQPQILRFATFHEGASFGRLISKMAQTSV